MMGGLVRWLVGLVAARLSVQVTRDRFPSASFSTWIRWTVSCRASRQSGSKGSAESCNIVRVSFRGWIRRVAVKERRRAGGCDGIALH